MKKHSRRSTKSKFDSYEDLDGYYGYQDKTFYVIDERLGDGAEGIVFSCYPIGNKKHKYAAKIFRPGKIHERIDKLNWLVTQNRNQRFKKLHNVVFPKQLLSIDATGDGQIVGYLMDYVPGVDLRATIGRTNWVINHWTRKELVQFCLSLLKTFIRLHEVGILMADINTSNIRVDEKEHKPWFIDTDSYQVTIEGDNNPTYLCNGYTIDFSTPKFVQQLANNEISFQRELDAEYHAITVLLFMVLMVGSNPYSKAGRSDLKQQIKAKAFQYSLEIKPNKVSQPKMRIWYSMTPEMRKTFHNTFAKEEPSSPEEWTKILTQYLGKIRNGYCSSEIFPLGNGTVAFDNQIFGLEPLPFRVDSSFYSELHQFVYNQQKDCIRSVIEIGGDSVRMITYDNPEDVKLTNRLDCNHLFVSEKVGLAISSRMNAEGVIDPLLAKNIIASAIDYVWEDIMGGKGIYPGCVFSYGTHWLRLAKNRRTIIQDLRTETDLMIGLTEEQEECRFSAQGIYLSILSSGLSDQDIPLINLELTPSCFRLVSHTPDGRNDYLNDSLGLLTLKRLLGPSGKNETRIAFNSINEIIERRILYLPIAEWMSRNGLETNNYLPIVSGDYWKIVLQGLIHESNLSFGKYFSISVSELQEILVRYKKYLSQFSSTELLIENACKEDSNVNSYLTAFLTLSLYIPILKRLGLENVYVFGRSSVYGALFYHCISK